MSILSGYDQLKFVHDTECLVRKPITSEGVAITDKTKEMVV